MDCFGVGIVDEVVSCGRLRWYGHVEHKYKGDGMHGITASGYKN